MSTYKVLSEYGRQVNNVKIMQSLIVNGIAKFNLGSDATGDMYYRDASGNTARLPVSTDGKVLTLSGGVPTWQTTSSGVTSYSALTDVNLTSIANGQLTKYNSTSGKWENFTPDYVSSSRTLTINGTTLDLSANRSWTIPDTNFTNTDLTFAANRTHDLSTYTLTLNAGGGVSYLQLAQDYFEVLLSPPGVSGNGVDIYTDITSTGGNVYMNAGITGDLAEVNFGRSTANAADERTYVLLKALAVKFDTAKLMLLQAPPAGTTSDSVLVRNTTTGVVKTIPTSTFQTAGSYQAQLNGTGFVKASGTTVSYDNSTYALDSSVVHLTGTEVITGQKSFSLSSEFRNGLSWKTTGQAGTNVQGQLGSRTNGTNYWGSVTIGNDINAFTGSLSYYNITLTASRNWIFPDADGTVALQSWVTAQGYVTGNQSITLSGDVSGTGTTTITTSIGANKVTNAMLAQMNANTIKGNNTAGAANATDLTGTQVTAMLDTFTSTLKGLTPSSGGGTVNFLRADGTWATPPGTLSPANPTASVGLTVVNGSASTYMRSDAAPALSQAITPTWTGQHQWTVVRTIASAASATLDDIDVNASTTTISGTTNITTATGFNKVSIMQPTFSGTVTISKAATLYVDNAPTITGGGVITAAYALWVGAGSSMFGGSITASSIVKSGGTSSQFLKADGSVDSNTYLTTSGASAAYQPLDADLTAIAALTGTSGFLKTNGSGTWSVDTSTYLTANQSITWTASTDVSGSASGTTSISPSLTVTGLRGVVLPTLGATAGLLKYTGTGTNTWVFDTNTYLTANQSITLSGDVSGTGTTAITTAIGTNKVTNAMLAQMAANTIKGNNTAGVANATDLTGTQVTAMLDAFTSALKGLAPASGGGTTNYLRADGTWTAPPGTLSAANPTASVGLTAVNGSATTYMRSDAAPALSQAIAPTWTGQHQWTVARTVASSASATLDDVVVNASTTTVTGTTGITTAKGFNKVSIYRPTITDGSAVTITSAATFYIDNSPLASGSVTITNTYALWVGSGNSLFGGNITATSIIKSGGTSSQFLKADGSVDSSTYLTANQSISLTGDVTGSGTTSIATTISAATVTGKALTGYAVGTNTSIVATDTILAAFGKVQAMLNNKQNTITTGTTSQYLRGDLSLATLDTSVVPENLNLYWTNNRAVTATLTGYSVGTATAVTSADSILGAFGKVQAQLNALPLATTGTVALASGTTTILSINKTTYKSAFVRYVIYNGTNQRSGQIIVTNDGTNVRFTETVTTDIGNTSVIVADVVVGATNFDIKITGVPDTTYTCKFNADYI